MKLFALVLIIGLIALALIIPVSATGKGGDGNGYGKLLQNGTGQALHSGECLNPNCPGEDCIGNQTPPRDGTGFQHGNKKCGKTR